MKLFCSFLFTIFFYVIISAQDPEEPIRPSLLTDRLYSDGFVYPTFLFDEQHAWLKLGYEITNSTRFEVQAFYDKYATSEERLRIPLMVKSYFSSKWYSFAGAEPEYLLGKAHGPRPVSGAMQTVKLKPRLDGIGGVGYDVQEDFMLEAKVNHQINNSKLPYKGQESNAGKNSLLTIGGRFKF